MEIYPIDRFKVTSCRIKSTARVRKAMKSFSLTRLLVEKRNFLIELFSLKTGWDREGDA